MILPDSSRKQGELLLKFAGNNRSAFPVVVKLTDWSEQTSILINHFITPGCDIILHGWTRSSKILARSGERYFAVPLTYGGSFRVMTVQYKGIRNLMRNGPKCNLKVVAPDYADATVFPGDVIQIPESVDIEKPNSNFVVLKKLSRISQNFEEIRVHWNNSAVFEEIIEGELKNTNSVSIKELVSIVKKQDIKVELIKPSEDVGRSNIDLPLSTPIILSDYITEQAVFASLQNPDSPAFHIPLRTLIYIKYLRQLDKRSSPLASKQCPKLSTLDRCVEELSSDVFSSLRPSQRSFESLEEIPDVDYIQTDERMQMNEVDDILSDSYTDSNVRSHEFIPDPGQNQSRINTSVTDRSAERDTGSDRALITGPFTNKSTERAADPVRDRITERTTEIVTNRPTYQVTNSTADRFTNHSTTDRFMDHSRTTSVPASRASGLATDHYFTNHSTSRTTNGSTSLVSSQATDHLKNPSMTARPRSTPVVYSGGAEEKINEKFTLRPPYRPTPSNISSNSSGGRRPLQLKNWGIKTAIAEHEQRTNSKLDRKKEQDLIKNTTGTFRWHGSRDGYTSDYTESVYKPRWGSFDRYPHSDNESPDDDFDVPVEIIRTSGARQDSRDEANRNTDRSASYVDARELDKNAKGNSSNRFESTSNADRGSVNKVIQDRQAAPVNTSDISNRSRNFDSRSGNISSTPPTQAGRPSGMFVSVPPPRRNLPSRAEPLIEHTLSDSNLSKITEQDLEDEENLEDEEESYSNKRGTDIQPMKSNNAGGQVEQSYNKNQTVNVQSSYSSSSGGNIHPSYNRNPTEAIPSSYSNNSVQNTRSSNISNTGVNVQTGYSRNSEAAKQPSYNNKQDNMKPSYINSQGNMQSSNNNSQGNILTSYTNSQGNIQPSYNNNQDNMRYSNNQRDSGQSSYTNNAGVNVQPRNSNSFEGNTGVQQSYSSNQRDIMRSSFNSNTGINEQPSYSHSSKPRDDIIQQSYEVTYNINRDEIIKPNYSNNSGDTTRVETSYSKNTGGNTQPSYSNSSRVNVPPNYSNNITAKVQPSVGSKDDLRYSRNVNDIEVQDEPRNAVSNKVSTNQFIDQNFNTNDALTSDLRNDGDGYDTVDIIQDANSKTNVSQENKKSEDLLNVEVNSPRSRSRSSVISVEMEQLLIEQQQQHEKEKEEMASQLEEQRRASEELQRLVMTELKKQEELRQIQQQEIERLKEEQKLILENNQNLKTLLHNQNSLSDSQSQRIGVINDRDDNSTNHRDSYTNSQNRKNDVPVNALGQSDHTTEVTNLIQNRSDRDSDLNFNRIRVEDQVKLSQNNEPGRFSKQPAVVQDQSINNSDSNVIMRPPRRFRQLSNVNKNLHADNDVSSENIALSSNENVVVVEVATTSMESLQTNSTGSKRLEISADGMHNTMQDFDENTIVEPILHEDEHFRLNYTDNFEHSGNIENNENYDNTENYDNSMDIVEEMHDVMDQSVEHDTTFDSSYHKSEILSNQLELEYQEHEEMQDYSELPDSFNYSDVNDVNQSELSTIQHTEFDDEALEEETEELYKSNLTIPDDGNISNLSPANFQELIEFLRLSQKARNYSLVTRMDGKQFSNMTDDEIRNNGLDHPILLHFKNLTTKNQNM